MAPVIGLWLLACTGGSDPPQDTYDTGAAQQLVSLESPALLRRLSLDLRGVLPSIQELDRVVSDPAALAQLQEAYLVDSRLEERLVAMLAERWFTLRDDFDIKFYDYGLTENQAYAFNRSVGEEPLRWLSRVAVTDRPWGEVATSGTLLANDMLLDIWPLEEVSPGGSGWREARYTDGRPAAGVLSSNGLWWRYSTTVFNLNRGRASALFRLLVCEDLLTRPVTFTATPSLLDQDGTAAAIREEPACQACHSAIEPVAAALFGFYPTEQYNTLELSTYHPEREPMGEEWLGVEAEWFGRPVSGLAALGQAIAADPRLASCAAQTFATALWRRPVDLADFEELNDLRQAFEDGGQTIRPLLRAVMDGAEYRAGSLIDDADEHAQRRQLRRLLSPDQLASVLKDLTGWTWTYRGYDLFRSDSFGYRVLFGGVDGESLLAPQDDAGLTWALVARRAAESAATTAVQAELRKGGEPVLFGDVDLDTRPEDDAFQDQLASLVWRLHATPATDADHAELTALWETLNAADGAETAWTGVLTTLFRDPAFLTY